VRLAGTAKELIAGRMENSDPQYRRNKFQDIETVGPLRRFRLSFFLSPFLIFHFVRLFPMLPH
jgi:hypothetical protein